MIIISTAYLGNIQYYTKLLSGEAVVDLGENYCKQSYRNRCEITGANGCIALTIPVLKTSGEKTPVNMVRIDYRREWQHQHWYSIMSAYGNSPFFDYFADDLIPFYRTRYEYLWEFNRALSDKILEITEITAAVKYSGKYMEPAKGDLDFRDAISPKPRLHMEDSAFVPRPYYQVFADRYGFTPNLSILDLLFCEGPQTGNIIRESDKRRLESI